MITNFKYLEPKIRVPWTWNEEFDAYKNNSEFRVFKAIFGHITWGEFIFNLNYYRKNNKIITVLSIKQGDQCWYNGIPNLKATDRVTFDLVIYDPN